MYRVGRINIVKFFILTKANDMFLKIPMTITLKEKICKIFSKKGGTE